MILKILTDRQGKEKNVFYDEWNYFDNIVSASSYFDEGSETAVVRCVFRDESCITFSILNVAYLMSDTGKTIERFVPAKVEDIGNADDAVYPTLQEAVEVAKKRSLNEED